MKKKKPKKEKQEFLSLHPLKFEDALRGLIKAKPENEKSRKNK
jgi:hypothetical protein